MIEINPNSNSLPMEDNLEENNSSLVIKNYLKEDIVRINTKHDLINKIGNDGYIKLPDNIVPKLDSVIRELPQISNAITNNNVYQVIYDKGLGTLQKSSKYPGYYLGGVVTKGTNNKYAGAALLKPISNVQQIAGATFSVLSLATGQYYMNQINKKLDDIILSISFIKDFLNDEKRSDLESYEHYFYGIVNNLEIMDENEIYRQSVLSELQNIQNKLFSSIQLYSKQIMRHKSNISSKDKIDDIVGKINDLGELVSSYKYSIILYMYSKILELLISKIMDELYIKSIINDLNNLEIIHQNNFKSWEDIYNEYLTNAKAFKDNEIMKALSKLKSTNVISTNLWLLLGSKLVGYSADYLNNLNKEKKSSMKEEQMNSIKNIFVENGELFEKYISYVDEYNQLCNSPISITRNNDGVYLKFLNNDL